MHRERSQGQQKQHQRRQGHSLDDMRGLDPTVVQAIPLSKQDTAGNSFLRFCSLLSWCTILAAAFAIVLDVMLVIMGGGGREVEVTLHCFGIPMAAAIILAELEVAFMLRLCAFLESWVLKGFYISFVGTLFLALNNPSTSLEVWRSVVLYILIATGVIYVTLGALCFRQLRSYQLGNIRRKKMMKQELVTLSSQKQEIEKLLADTESKLELL